MLMTVLTALLSLGFGCAEAARLHLHDGPGIAVAGPHEDGRDRHDGIGHDGMDHGDTAGTAPCHAEDSACPWCTRAVLAGTDIGDFAAAPHHPTRMAVLAYPAETASPAAGPSAPPSSRKWMPPPPGHETPVARKTVLLN